MAKRESIWKANDGSEHRSKQSAADALVTGGWRKMKAYKVQVKAKAELVRLNVQMTNTVRTEAEAVKAWETAAPSDSFHVWTPMLWGNE